MGNFTLGGITLRNARLQKRLTIPEFAQATGLNELYITQIENGEASPTFDEVVLALPKLGLWLEYATIPIDDSNDNHRIHQKQMTMQERLYNNYSRLQNTKKGRLLTLQKAEKETLLNE